MNKWKSVLKICLTALCLISVVLHFIWHADDLTKLYNLSMVHIVIVALLQLAYQMVFISRSLAVVRKCSIGVITFWQWFRVSATGRFLSLFVPQMGNIYQGISLKRNYQISFTQYATVKFSLAWIDFIFNMIFAAIIILCVDRSFEILTLPAPVFLMIPAILAAVIPFVSRWVIHAAPVKNQGILWLKIRLEELLTNTLKNLRDTFYLINVITQGILIFSITCGVLYTCFAGLGAEPSIPSIVLFCALLKISDHAALTPGNLGIREVLFGLLGEYFGLGVSEGILVSIIRRVISQIEITAIAAIIYFQDLVQGSKGHGQPSENNPYDHDKPTEHNPED